MPQLSSNPVVAIIPARAGSKGIPGKNLKPVGGVPLIARAADSARRAQRIDRVFVSTDGAEIAATARAAGAEIIGRPADISGDTASSESALLHALETIEAKGVEVGILVFIQATSPFIDPDDLDAAIARVQDGESDVVFSATQSHAFMWKESSDGAAIAVGHDASFRPRRQDRKPQFRETGAFYVMNAAGFREARFRFFGRVGIAAVDERLSLEIDTPEELELADLLARVSGEAPPAIDVDVVVTDFDGVHTDDSVKVSEDGTESVTVNRRDGHGVKMLREAGIPVLILSTEKNPVVSARAAKLGVDVIQGVDDKATILTAWASEHGTPLDRIAYLGNDVNDLGALDAVGWPVAVGDGHPAAIAAARHVLSSKGGDGAVRELAELVLGARHTPTQNPDAQKEETP